MPLSKKPRKEMGREQLSKEELIAAAKANSLPQHVPPMPVGCSWEFLHMEGPDAEDPEKVLHWLVVVFYTPLGPMHIFYRKDKGQLFLDHMKGALEAMPDESGIVTPPSGLVVAR